MWGDDFVFSGFYTIASGLLTRQREIDVIGNNMVNMNTPGYKADRLTSTSFNQELLIRMEKNGKKIIGSGAPAAIVDDVVTMMSSGHLKNTDRNLDFAVGGNGYFNVVDAQGEQCLTRNGSFEVDEEGYLQLSGIGRVIGKSGNPILVGTDAINVSYDGDIYAPTGEYIDSFLITQPIIGAGLVKKDNGTILVPDGTEESEQYNIYQNSLELSNVDANKEMMLLIEAQRSFQTCSSAMQTIDSINRKAATQLGSIQ